MIAILFSLVTLSTVAAMESDSYETGDKENFFDISEFNCRWVLNGDTISLNLSNSNVLRIDDSILDSLHNQLKKDKLILYKINLSFSQNYLTTESLLTILNKLEKFKCNSIYLDLSLNKQLGNKENASQDDLKTLIKTLSKFKTKITISFVDCGFKEKQIDILNTINNTNVHLIWIYEDNDEEDDEDNDEDNDEERFGNHSDQSTYGRTKNEFLNIESLSHSDPKH